MVKGRSYELALCQWVSLELARGVRVRGKCEGYVEEAEWASGCVVSFDVASQDHLFG